VIIMAKQTMAEQKNKEQKKVVSPEQAASLSDEIDPHDIIKYPLSTEKSIRQIEFGNSLIFVVNPRATKGDVKKAVEQLFNVKVAKVNVQNSFSGYKKAYVKLAAGSIASDVSADLGLI